MIINVDLTALYYASKIVMKALIISGRMLHSKEGLFLQQPDMVVLCDMRQHSEHLQNVEVEENNGMSG